MIEIDTRGFEKALKEYMQYTKRSLPEACNQHAYYIARDAVLLTKGADKNEIENKLRGPANDYPNAPLAAIIVNAQLGKQGKKGLTGEKMAKAVEKYIRSAKSHVNFLKSGWIPAIKRLANVVPKKGGSKIPSGTDKRGRNFGGATPAVFGLDPVATIWNSIQGSKTHGDKSEKVRRILLDGAQKAVDMETQSMRDYIARKQSEIIKQTFG